MKSIRNIAFSALLALGAFTTVTYTACNPDECKDVTCSNNGTCVDGTCKCPNYYEGTTCQTEVRTKYYNTYIGDGVDNDNETYDDWKMEFKARGADAKNMSLTLMNKAGVTQATVNVILQSNETFLVEQMTDGDDIITGSGTVNVNSASLTLTFTDKNNSTNVLTFTFSNMLKQQ